MKESAAFYAALRARSVKSLTESFAVSYYYPSRRTEPFARQKSRLWRFFLRKSVARPSSLSSCICAV